MHTSYFLFVMVITMFCYAVIKGRPGKVRQTNPDFCPEKVQQTQTYDVIGSYGNFYGNQGTSLITSSYYSWLISQSLHIKGEELIYSQHYLLNVLRWRIQIITASYVYVDLLLA